MCKWLSNEKEVLQDTEEVERVSGTRDLNLQALPVERALGVQWDADADMLVYDVKRMCHPTTQRGLLGDVCSVYDPLGLLTPFTIRGKRLVQDLTRGQIGWDEPLTDRSLGEWKAWVEELAGIGQVRVPRCIQPSGFGELSGVELHHFSDVSVTAYGSATYVRLVNTGDEVQCSLLYTCYRVVPLKQMTIPRLELAAAALSIQQDQLVRRELSLPIVNSTFWTDSTIVLAYINNEKRCFHMYVSNRLAVIHSGSTLKQWRHMRTDENPADDISRGLGLSDLVHSSRWFCGPRFLSELVIPPQEMEAAGINDGDPEVK